MKKIKPQWGGAGFFSCFADAVSDVHPPPSLDREQRRSCLLLLTFRNLVTPDLLLRSDGLRIHRFTRSVVVSGSVHVALCVYLVFVPIYPPSVLKKLPPSET